MFAPPVAKPKTKLAASSTNKLALERSALAGHRFGHGTVEQARLTGNEPGAHAKEAYAASTVGREAAPRVSWDFSKIPVFPPGREERFQMPPLFPAPRLPIQAKLKLCQVDDPLEHEADRVADQVMRMPDPEVSIASAPPQLSRKCAACEEEVKLQKKPAGAEPAAGEAPAIVHEVLRSPGQPLDVATRDFFEPRFGHDFSHVRVHTDARAAESARSLHALAYTVGHGIAFAVGQYTPATQKGKWLLAHELAHAVQQENHAAQQKALVSDPTEVSEQEADRLAEQVVHNSPASPKAQENRLVAPEAMVLRYRSNREQFFGREDDPARGLVEETFRDPENQPFIEHITVTFDGKKVDTNSNLAAVASADRLMATGELHATYRKNKAARADIDTPVDGGSSIYGLADRGDFAVHRIEGVGYNAARRPGEVVAPRIPGTKYTNLDLSGDANMHYAVFFNVLQALHIGPPNVGSHACIHVPNPPMQQINNYSVEKRTKVSVSYSSASALAEICCARLRQTGKKGNPCERVGCPP